MIGSLGVRAQGNRGVIINNTKFDDLNGIHPTQMHQINTTVPSATIASTIDSKVIVYFLGWKISFTPDFVDVRKALFLLLTT